MNIKVNKKIGDCTFLFEVAEKDDMSTLHVAAVLSSAPDYCQECKNDSFFKLDSNKDKEGNIYVNVVCRKCGAKAKLGRYKTGGYFWHKFEKYEKHEQSGDIVQQAIDAGVVSGGDEVPF